MKIETYNIISLVFQFFITVGAIVFGLWQVKINLKLKKLQESVGLSIVPGVGLNLHLMNVGGVNLYLRKYEIGPETENFSKPLLIAAGTGKNSFLQIETPNFQRNKTYDIKLYLIDEFKEKYLSSGQLIIEDIDMMVPAIANYDISITGATSEPSLSMVKIKSPRIKAWSYQTEKYNWII